MKMRDLCANKGKLSIKRRRDQKYLIFGLQKRARMVGREEERKEEEKRIRRRKEKRREVKRRGREEKKKSQKGMEF